MYVRPYVNDILEEKGPKYIYIVILVNTEWRFNIWFRIKKYVGFITTIYG